MTVSAMEMKAASARVSHSLALQSTSASHAASTVARASTVSSSATANTITSSDFLSLLVTEMKNQDPTQPTDPNAYIQQLVGVNSLQQLISIDQELGAATTTPPTPALSSPSTTTNASTLAATSPVNNL